MAMPHQGSHLKKHTQVLMPCGLSICFWMILMVYPDGVVVESQGKSEYHPTVYGFTPELLLAWLMGKDKMERREREERL